MTLFHRDKLEVFYCSSEARTIIMREFVEVKKYFSPVNTPFHFFIFTLLIFQPDTFREDNRNDDNCFMETIP